jgi:hypothetical protein
MSADRVRRAAVLVAIGSVYALLNATKPLHIDDPFTFWVAKQILASPFDPFGFDIFWYQWPQPTHEDLLAPVVGYWGALGLALTGERPFLWKLSLLPIAVLFAWSLHDLARRFARGLEWPLVTLTLFSPAFLPSLNYMQDVPALALGLAALAVYLRGEEQGSWALVLGAGLLAGLAMQTKYTAFSTTCAIVLHALLWRKSRFGLAAAGVATLVFAGWEVLMTLRYDHGMFLFQAGFPLWWSPRHHLIVPLVCLLGATLPALGLLALSVLGLGRRVLVALGVSILAGHAFLLVAPLQYWLYLFVGLGCAVALTGLVIAPWRRRRREVSALQWLVRRRSELFLTLWLAGEAVSYFALSYFPAIRRVLPATIAATLLVGHAAALAARRRQLPIVPITAFSIALGFVYYGVDWLEADAQRRAAQQSLLSIRANDLEGTVWFTGHWGFQYYAEALGMKPLVPDYSELRRGDWLVVPSRVDAQAVELDPAVLELVAVAEIPSRVSLATSYGYYAGFTALEHFLGPRVVTRIFRARASTVPESAWSTAQVVEWATRAGGRQAAWAERALRRGLARSANPAERGAAVEALGLLGSRAIEASPALIRSLREDPDPGVRRAAAIALSEMGRNDPALRTALIAAAQLDSAAEVREAARKSLTRLSRATTP